ncbi:MAG: nuclear transport factor 2 family protein [Spirulinaceae cyanobacterium]
MTIVLLSQLSLMSQIPFASHSRQKLSQPAAKFRFAPLNWSFSLLLSLSLIVSLAEVVRADSPESAPQEVKEFLSTMEMSANAKDAEQVEQFYSPNFVNSDGLNRADLMAGIKELWTRYPQLSYRTELNSWEQQNNQIVVETTTYINGIQAVQGKTTNLEATLRSRQYWENNQIVRQDVLEEKTVLTSGNNPPQVEINLPQTVRAGRQFFFDAVVTEPLGDDILLGIALDEKVNPQRYTDPSSFELDLLPAGGIYKVGRAPSETGSRWISAILIRSDGMTIVSQRLQVVESR